jgi:hypothetical protein
MVAQCDIMESVTGKARHKLDTSKSLQAIHMNRVHPHKNGGNIRYAALLITAALALGCLQSSYHFVQPGQLQTTVAGSNRRAMMHNDKQTPANTDAYTPAEAQGNHRRHTQHSTS